MKKIKMLSIFLLSIMMIIVGGTSFISAATTTPAEIWQVKKVGSSMCAYKNSKVIAKATYDYKVKYTTTAVNVRRAATVRGKYVKTLKKGTAVKTYGTVIYKNSKWDFVKIGTGYYFMCSKYLSTKKPAAASSAVTKIVYSPSVFRNKGVVHWGGWRWTYYSQRVLPGGGLKIPGRHVNSMGYVCDGNGYICLAATSLRKGTIVDTPFGAKGKVYDSGCPYGTLDVYTNW